MAGQPCLARADQVAAGAGGMARPIAALSVFPAPTRVLPVRVGVRRATAGGDRQFPPQIGDGRRISSIERHIVESGGDDACLLNPLKSSGTASLGPGELSRGRGS